MKDMGLLYHLKPIIKLTQPLIYLIQGLDKPCEILLTVCNDVHSRSFIAEVMVARICVRVSN